MTSNNSSDEQSKASNGKATAPAPAADKPAPSLTSLDTQQIYRGNTPDTTESDARYAAYAIRVKTILRSAHRYVAYTSDIGESFRPVAHPYLIRGAYAVSWAYLAGDVANEGYKAYHRNQVALKDAAGPNAHFSATAEAASKEKKTTPTATIEPGAAAASVAAAASQDNALTPARRRDLVPPIEDYRTVMAQRAIFQSLASMGLPAFTIHSTVKYSGRAFKNVQNKKIRSYGPIGLGLAIVPFLPFIFDEPVEHAVEWTFHKGFELLKERPPSQDTKKEL